MQIFTRRRIPPWRAVAAAGGLLSITTVVVISALACERYAYARSLRTGRSVAAYLAIVTPRARGPGGGYQPARLIAQTRALSTLKGFSEGVEVYHGTAPLVHATGIVLPPTTYDSVRRWDNGIRWEDRALVALRRRGDSAVVGAVAVARRPDQPWPVSPFVLLFAVIALAAGWRAWHAADPDALAVYAVAMLALGAAAGIQVRRAAVASVNHWLLDARLLIQEAVARAPRGRVPLQELGRVAPGTLLRPGQPGSSTPRREQSPDGPTAVVPVRLSGARWLELRATPAVPPTAGWWMLLLASSSVGPGLLALARWRSPGAQPGSGGGRGGGGVVPKGSKRSSQDEIGFRERLT